MVEHETYEDFVASDEYEAKNKASDLGRRLWELEKIVSIQQETLKEIVNVLKNLTK